MTIKREFPKPTPPPPTPPPPLLSHYCSGVLQLQVRQLNNLLLHHRFIRRRLLKMTTHVLKRKVRLTCLQRNATTMELQMFQKSQGSKGHLLKRKHQKCLIMASMETWSRLLPITEGGQMGVFHGLHSLQLCNTWKGIIHIVTCLGHGSVTQIRTP